MRIMRSSSLMAIVCFFSILTVAQKSESQKSDNRDEQEIRRLNVEEGDAFVRNDPDALAKMWSDDFVVTNPLNKFVTKQQVLGMIHSGFLVITSYKRDVEYVRIYPCDTAIVAGSELVTWGGKMPNAGKSQRLRFTAVWMKQGGRWQEVARHANILPD